MTGTFACPECGRRVGPAGIPGRQVRCSGCATLLEVPFIPRVARKRRRSRRAARRRAVLIGGVVVAVVVGALAGGIGLARASWRRHTEREIAAGIETARQAEQAGEFEQAAAEVAAILDRSRWSRIHPAIDLAAWRAELVRRGAARRLEALASRPPHEAVAEAAALHETARNEPALADQLPAIGEALAAARCRAAEADLSAARRVLDAGQPAEALTHAAAAWKAAEPLATDVAARLRAEADEVAGAVAERFGLLVDPPSGRFFLGSPAEYETLLLRPALEALCDRGYVPAPSEPAAWRAIWTGRAPTRFHLDVDEQPEPYLQSANRGTKLVVRPALIRHGAPLSLATINAQTRIPPSGMPAYEASVLATAPRRTEAAEQRLRRDAIDQVRDRLNAQLRNVPAP
jgi:hypothetical protein